MPSGSHILTTPVLYHPLRARLKMAVYQQVRPQINEPFIPYEQYQLFQQQMQGNYDLTRADTEWFMQPLDLQDETSTTLIDPDQLQIMRHADTALTSWGFEKSHFKRLSSRLSLSGRGSGSEIDVKSFLAKKGAELIITSVSILYLCNLCLGKTELDGLHRAASKGDTNWIMNIIKVNNNMFSARILPILLIERRIKCSIE